MTPYMGAATLSYCLMTTGVILRKEKKIHMPLMITAIVLDLAIVLILQIKRHAIQTASEGTLNGLQKSHIAFSTIAVLLYIPVAIFGLKKISKRTKRTQPSHSKLHQKFGICAYIFRTLGFITMFSLLSHIKAH